VLLHQVAEMSYEDLMQIHDSIETTSPEPMVRSSTSSSDGAGAGSDGGGAGSDGGSSSSGGGSDGGRKSTCDSSTMNTDPEKHTKNAAALSSFPLFSKNNSHRPGNFVYGEINPASVANLLEIVKPKRGEVIVDLGSGAGKVCFCDMKEENTHTHTHQE
jgi:hypothetical protein